MRFPRLSGALVSIPLFSSCSILTNSGNLAPIPSKEEYLTFSQKLDPNSSKLSQFKSELVNIIGTYHHYASDRRRMEWDSTGMTTFGGLGAVLGALADKTGLLNVGAGVAGVGLAVSSRYSFSQQSQVYFVALKKFSCIHSKVSSLSDTVLEDAKGSDDKDAAKIAEGAMAQLIDSIESIRIEANNGILGIAPRVPTREEWLAMFGSYKDSSGLAVNAAAPPDADTARKRAAGERIKTMLSDVGICVKA